MCVKLKSDVLVLASACPSFSIPGNDIAIFLNRLFTLCPALADVSMNMMLSCVDLAVASSNVTCLTMMQGKMLHISKRRPRTGVARTVYLRGPPCYRQVLL